jgi:hypothetical protein
MTAVLWLGSLAAAFAFGLWAAPAGKPQNMLLKSDDQCASAADYGNVSVNPKTGLPRICRPM